MARPEKTAAVEEIRTRLTESDAAVLTEYRGLTVPELAELRGTLRAAGTQYKVFKNTLARLAVESAGLTELLPMLSGPTAIAFVQGDAVLAAKALRDFGKANQALVIKGGLLGPRVLAPSDVAALAEVEPREVLLAKLAGGFQAPLVKAAGLFQAFTRNFAYGLKAYVDQRVDGGEVLEAPEVEAPEVEAPEVEAPEVEAPEVEAPQAAATETDALATAETETEAPAAAETETETEAPAADAEAATTEASTEES